MAAHPNFTISKDHRSYLPSGSFWKGSTTTASTDAKWRSLRNRIVRLCRRAVAAIAMSANPGE